MGERLFPCVLRCCYSNCREDDLDRRIATNLKSVEACVDRKAVHLAHQSFSTGRRQLCTRLLRQRRSWSEYVGPVHTGAACSCSAMILSSPTRVPGGISGEFVLAAPVLPKRTRAMPAGGQPVTNLDGVSASGDRVNTVSGARLALRFTALAGVHAFGAVTNASGISHQSAMTGSFNGPEIWLTAAVVMLMMICVFSAYQASLRTTRKRFRELSSSMEQFVTNGLQGEISFRYDHESHPSPGVWTRAMSADAEIARVETCAELMASAIQESKRRMLERERQHLNWLSFLCHDLSAPLLRVLTRIEALEYNEELTAKQAEMALDSAHIEITHMTQLISSVNDFAQAECGTVRPFEEVSLDQLLEYLIAVFEFDANRKSIELDLRIIPGMGPVRMDKLLIRRALENLISNALRFTPAGGLVSLRAEQRDGMICISVCDTGTGIAPEELERIFELRYRGKGQDSSTRCSSLGLGLALVRRVADLHNGAVAVRNLEPEGAQFVLSIPAERLDSTGE
jgi:signal transduction histidine kinase